MTVLFEQTLETGVKLIGREVELTGRGDHLVMETEGLGTVKKGARDIALVIPADDAELRFPECASLLSMLSSAIVQGAAFDVGDRVVLSGKVLGEHAGIGFAPPHALPAQRGDGQRMIAVPLLMEELIAVERSGLPRVLARLGKAHKFFPYPPWVARERAPAITNADLEGSPFANGMPVAGEFSAVLHDDTVVLRPGPRAAALLVEALGAGKPFLCATPLDETWCGIAVVYDGPGKAPLGVTRGGLEGPAGLSFVAITIGNEKRGAKGFEDGAGVIVKASDAAELVAALKAGAPYDLVDVDADRLKLHVDPPAS